MLFLTSQMASGLFRLIASLGRDLTASNTFGSFALLVLFANCGFILSRGMIINKLEAGIFTRLNIEKWFSLLFFCLPQIR